MGRFSDLNRKLKNELSSKDDFSKLISSKSQIDPILKRIQEIFSDYLNEVIEPRIKITTIFQSSTAKQKTFFKSRTRPSIFRLLFNIIPPKKQWPMKIVSGENIDFATPGEISNLSWHPNVIFQLAVDLKDQYDLSNKEYHCILQPIITIRVWGHLVPPESSVLKSKSPAGFLFKSGEHINISTGMDGGWGKSSSAITIYISDKNVHLIEEIFTNSLEISTPSIFNYFD